MIRKLLTPDSSSFIYLCDFKQMRRYIKEADLSQLELNQLKSEFDKRIQKSFVFLEIIQQEIDKKIKIKNEQIKQTQNESIQRKKRVKSY